MPRLLRFVIFKIRAIFGDAQACNDLGWLYHIGIYVKKDCKKAYEYYQRAANKGNADAQMNLATLYQDGECVSQNSKLAMELYKKSAEQGHPGAINSLGVMYSCGEGVEKNDRLAEKYFRTAAEKYNFAIAQYNLGWAYLEEKGVPRDERKAFELFKQAAGAGYSEAEFALGKCYLDGIGIDINIPEAMGWLHKASISGSEQADELIQNIEKGQTEAPPASRRP